MTLWILAFEPKCRSAIPSIVSPLCTEYANVSRDVGLVLRLGFATLAPGIDPGADDASSMTLLLASPSFAPDEGGIGAAVPSGEAPVCESVGMWDTALTLASRFCATFALTSDGFVSPRNISSILGASLTLRKHRPANAASPTLVSEIAGCAIIERRAGRRSG